MKYEGPPCPACGAQMTTAQFGDVAICFARTCVKQYEVQHVGADSGEIPNDDSRPAAQATNEDD